VTRRALLLALAISVTLQGATACAQSSRTLFERESQYNHVVVTEEDGLRTMNFRRHHTDYHETVFDPAHPLRLVNEYTRLMMTSLIFVQRPQKVLMIGLGGGIVTRVMSHYSPTTTFDNVELDQAVVDAATQHFGFAPGPRMRVHVRDGRIFLRQSRDRYDMIILDAFRGGYIPFHLKTEEFLQMVREHLAPNGIVVGNLHAGTQLYDADRATYAAVFDQIYPFAGREDSNVILIATSGTKRLTTAELRTRAEQLQRAYNFTFDLPAQVGFYEERPNYDRRAKVLTDDHAPVEALDEQRN
jgi:spermidine synthase